MKGFKLMGALMLIFVSAILAAGIASAADVPVSLQKIWIDGTEFAVLGNSSDDNMITLDMEKGQILDIKVKVAAENADDRIQVKAAIRGYEYDDRDKTSDITHVFDVEGNATYTKEIQLELPDKMEDDKYILRITLVNRNDEQKSYDFSLQVSSERHNLQIKDIDFFPENSVEAGKSFQAKVRIKNIGAKDEQSVKVRVMVPELGISASTYIDLIESGDTESTEEMWVKVPECAEEGAYKAMIMVGYDEMYETVLASKQLFVKGDICKAAEAVEDDEEILQPEADSAVPADDSADEGQKTELLRNALEIGLIGLIIALVILGLVIGFMSLAKENTKENKEL